MTSLSEELYKAVALLRGADLDGRDGLPEDLFHLVSGLIPLPNVDLLVTNAAGQLLLTRRNDDFYEPSWHIPGGCMRFGEDFARRIQQTALRELGTQVQFEETPLAVRNVLRGRNEKQVHPNERGHNVAILFRCSVPLGYEPDNGGKHEWEDGYCKWFDWLPHDFMTIQNVYLDVLRPWVREEETV